MRRTSLPSVCALACFIAACGETSSGPETAPSIVVTPNSVVFTSLGDMAQLSAAVRDGSGTVITAPTVVWTSDDPGVVSASAGTLVAQGDGATTVRASSLGASTTVNVTVAREVAAVAVSPDSLVLAYQSGSDQLSATVRDARGHAIAGVTPVWSSSDEAVASVDQGGVVAAGVAGRASIVATVGSVQASATAIVHLPPNPGANATTSHDLQKTDLHVARSLMIDGSCGCSLQAFVYDDFTGDGLTDVLIHPQDDTPDPFWYQLLTNDGAGGFVPGPVLSDGALVFARKALKGDFNGDGLHDVFLIGHGWDHNPFPGEAPSVLFSQGDGTFAVGQDFQALSGAGVDSLVDFYHGGASADMDGDGDIDVLLAGHIDRTGVVLLLNDGTGVFSIDRTMIPQTVYRSQTIEVLDIDLDGFMDLVLSPREDEYPSTEIFWGGVEGWSADDKTPLAASAGWWNIEDIDMADLDGDGSIDVVQSRHNGFAGGHGMQVLLQTSPRTFVEGWSHYELYPPDRVDWIRLQDYDGNGSTDILADDAQLNWIWLNDGAGTFTLN